MQPPQFSIVIPSRNRLDDFSRALDSVLAQSCSNVEVVVIIDGAKDGEEEAYKQLARDAGASNVTYSCLPFRTNGHGPAFARNEGVQVASGQYVCFLDDDDIWTDTEHLSRTASVIENSANKIDLYFSLQVAEHPDGRVDRNVWLSGLEDWVTRRYSPDQWGAYKLGLDDLMKADGFCHLNTTVVRRQFFLDVGGFDETLRYEQDRDFFMRAIDVANEIRFNPIYIAHHYVPQKAAGTSASTRVGELEKKMIQLKLLDKHILFAENLSIRLFARKHKGYTLRKIAIVLASQGRFQEAALYSREALAVSFGFKWCAYTLFLSLKNLTR